MSRAFPFTKVNYLLTIDFFSISFDNVKLTNQRLKLIESSPAGSKGRIRSYRRNTPRRTISLARSGREERRDRANHQQTQRRVEDRGRTKTSTSDSCHTCNSTIRLGTARTLCEAKLEVQREELERRFAARLTASGTTSVKPRQLT